NGEVEKDIGPQFLVRNWPDVFVEWNTRSLRDAFFSSPKFPRLLDPEKLKDTISRGVSQGVLAYVGKHPDGSYSPFLFCEALNPVDVEISEDMYVIRQETAQAARGQIEADKSGKTLPAGSQVSEPPASPYTPTPGADDPTIQPITGENLAAQPVTETPTTKHPLKKLSWSGEIDPQKWMNFYTKVLSKHVSDKNLRLTVSFKTEPEAGISKERMEETKHALRELELDPEKLEKN
ncbi:MAG: AAA family ATPase, partial [Gammaproteobacteria bacterium]|nr:AAA family ATPase [Gammaproteobacteria bacterium]